MKKRTCKSRGVEKEDRSDEAYDMQKLWYIRSCLTEGELMTLSLLSLLTSMMRFCIAEGREERRWVVGIYSVGMEQLAEKTTIPNISFVFFES